ncbi:PspC domain-containing protein [Yinghuangia aomiensis]
MTTAPPRPPRPRPHAPRPGRAHVSTATPRRIVARGHGLADQFAVDVVWIRVGFAVLTDTGIGVAVYGLLWLNVPEGGPARRHPSPPRANAAAGMRLLAIVTLLLAFTMLMMIGGSSAGGKGDHLAAPGRRRGHRLVSWRQADDAQPRHPSLSLDGRRRTWAHRHRRRRLLHRNVSSSSPTAAASATSSRPSAAPCCCSSGSSSSSAPLPAPPDPRPQCRAPGPHPRAQERAEVAAHVHDSVLHTLTPIQRHVDDPREVARLARAQERELRAWLYRPEGEEPDRTFAAAPAPRRPPRVEEDMHGVAIEIVPVGDCAVDERLAAQRLQGGARGDGECREVRVRARRSRCSAEVEDTAVTVFDARQRALGFDPDTLPRGPDGCADDPRADAPQRRHRGDHSEPGEGTEVELECLAARRQSKS